MIGYADPRRGLVDRDQAIQRSRSVLAQVIRADVMNYLADDSGRVEDAVPARQVLRSVRAVMGDSPILSNYVLIDALIGCNNCRLHGRDVEARAWLEEAEREYRAVAIAANPDLLQIRNLYLLLRDGSADALDAESRDAGLANGDAAPCYAHAAFLLRHNRTAEGLAYLDQVRSGKCIPWLRVGLLAGGDPTVTRAECRRGLTGTVDSSYCPFKTYSACLAGLPDDARREARIYHDQPARGIEWDEYPPFIRRAVNHAFNGMPLDIEAEIGDSRFKRAYAYDAFGFAALSRGDRATASKWFQKAGEHTPLLSHRHLWMREVRRRVVENPTWPAWLAEKK